ncbi:MAG TPA: superoxide dismutase family protein, partial [Longimicrobiales bacterium]|nr:superoxide dismutase family protein [Longimicrobiales bacterium]
RPADSPDDTVPPPMPAADSRAGAQVDGDHIVPGVVPGGAVVELVDRTGQRVGGARLEDTAQGVRISIRVTGLSEGEHGLHFHEAGRCDPPDFQSAGGHFAPHGRQHGFENPAGPHAGDLPNLRANAQGVADTSFVAAAVRLSAAAAEGLLREGGTALVVHARRDDYRTDPSGDSGDRIACGVVRAGGS